MQWKGPFDIVERLGDMDYKVNIDGKIKTILANLLKQYIEREDECCGANSACGVSLIDFDGDDDETDDNKEHILLPPAVQTETYRNYASRLQMFLLIYLESQIWWNTE